MQTYIDLHRHAAVRAALTAAQGRAAADGRARHRGLASVACRAEPQAARNDAVAESVETCRGETVFDAKRRAVLAAARLRSRGRRPCRWRVEGAEGDALPPFSAAARPARPVVMDVIAVLMGETLAAGSPAVEAVGLELGVAMADWWQAADAAFFELVRDKEVLAAIVAEVAGETVAKRQPGREDQGAQADRRRPSRRRRWPRQGRALGAALDGVPALRLYRHAAAASARSLRRQWLALEAAGVGQEFSASVGRGRHRTGFCDIGCGHFAHRTDHGGDDARLDRIARPPARCHPPSPPSDAIEAIMARDRVEGPGDQVRRVTVLVPPHSEQTSLRRSNPFAPASSRALWLACCRTESPSVDATQSSQIGAGDRRVISALTSSSHQCRAPSLRRSRSRSSRWRAPAM
jgi:hypothetical protein